MEKFTAAKNTIWKFNWQFKWLQMTVIYAFYCRLVRVLIDVLLDGLGWLSKCLWVNDEGKVLFVFRRNNLKFRIILQNENFINIIRKNLCFFLVFLGGKNNNFHCYDVNSLHQAKIITINVKFYINRMLWNLPVILQIKNIFHKNLKLKNQLKYHNQFSFKISSSLI